MLVEGPHFRLERVEGLPDLALAERFAEGPLLIIPLQGEFTLDTDIIAAGACGVASAVEAIGFPFQGTCLLAQSYVQKGESDNR